MLLATSPSPEFALAQIGLVEIASAFAAQRRSNTLTLAEYDRVMDALFDDVRSRYRVVAISQPLIEFAVELTRRRKLRGCDAIQLAAAMTLNRSQHSSGLPPLTFVCADRDLLVAAQAEGLPTENPNDYP